MSEQSAPPAGTKSGRLPPYSDEAEKGVLGSVLQDAGIFDLCAESKLLAESFYVPAHRIVYETIGEMFGAGRPIDVLTVADKLKETGAIEKIGGELYLHRLIDSTPTTAHAGYYIGIVRQKHLLRRIIECAREAENDCYTSEEDAMTLLGRVEQNFLDIAEVQSGSREDWPEMVRAVMRQIDEMGRGGSKDSLRTGFTDLDRQIVGMRRGNMIILAARPSMGKTSLAMNIAENVARGHGTGVEPLPVGIFSLEMSKEDLVMRMLCTHAGVSMHKIRQGYLSSSDKNAEHRRLVTAADVLGKAPIFMDDSAGLDVMELRARARRMKQKHDVRFIIVDYLQLLHHRESARQGRQLETAAISGAIKAMAKELGVPVMVLSQLSRAPETRGGDNKPRLSDLRDSGSIEQDADIVLLLRRPCMIPGERDEAQSADRTRAVIDLAKNRNGPTVDDIIMVFEEEFTRFSDSATGHGVDDFGPDAAERPADEDGGGRE